MTKEPVVAVSVTLPLSQVSELNRRASDESRKLSHVMSEAVGFFLDRVPSSRQQEATAAADQVVAGE